MTQLGQFNHLDWGESGLYTEHFIFTSKATNSLEYGVHHQIHQSRKSVIIDETSTESSRYGLCPKVDFYLIERNQVFRHSFENQ